jgi:hypothetical protein
LSRPSVEATNSVVAPAPVRGAAVHDQVGRAVGVAQQPLANSMNTAALTVPSVHHEPQRALYQQNPDAVQRWKDEQFPAIRKQAKAEVTIYFAEEAEIVRTITPAPPGPRSAHPVVGATGAGSRSTRYLG